MKYLIIIFCIYTQQLLAQTTELSIGDTVPEITLTKIFRQETSTKNLKSFYKKILIIDFWGTWCEPCVLALPKLDSLQKTFAGQITVLPVSDEPYNTVKKTMLSNSNLKTVSLPSVTGDKKLSGIFPHRMVPHEVWINEKGIVVAITSEREITEENIKLALDGNTASLPVKRDQMDFDLFRPLVKLHWQNNDSLSAEAVRNYSVVLKYQPGLPAATNLWVPDLEKARKSADNTYWMNGISCLNCSILSFFIFAFDLTYSRIMSPSINPNRIVLDVYDSAKYILSTAPGVQPPESYRWSHSFGYEMKIPKAIPDSLFGLRMLQDLNQHFELKGRIITKEVPCWYIVKMDQRADTLKSQPGAPEIVATNESIGIRNKNLSVLLAFLNVFDKMEPVIDQTGIQRPIDLDLHIPPNFNDYPNIVQIRKSLNDAGLDLVKGRQKMKLLYLTDKPENYPVTP